MLCLHNIYILMKVVLVMNIHRIIWGTTLYSKEIKPWRWSWMLCLHNIYILMKVITTLRVCFDSRGVSGIHPPLKCRDRAVLMHCDVQSLLHAESLCVWSREAIQEYSKLLTYRTNIWQEACHHYVWKLYWLWFVDLLAWFLVKRIA
jgi:hypothetical protein